jgi:hypothetical protein
VHLYQQGLEMDFDKTALAYGGAVAVSVLTATYPYRSADIRPWTISKPTTPSRYWRRLWVVGLLVGAIGFFCNQIKIRWYASDLSDLEYVYAVVKD